MDSKELRNISNKILDKITSENIKDSDKVEIIMDILDGVVRSQRRVGRNLVINHMFDELSNLRD